MQRKKKASATVAVVVVLFSAAIRFALLLAGAPNKPVEILELS